MALKNIPYDQKYYDPEIETMPRAELEDLQLGYLKDELKQTILILKESN